MDTSAVVSAPPPPASPWSGWRWLLGALAAACVAQLLLSRGGGLDGLLTYALAGMLLVRGLRRSNLDLAPLPPTDQPTWLPNTRRWHRQARFSIVFFAVLGFLAAGGNRLSGPTVLTFLLAMGAYVYVFGEPVPLRWPRLRPLASTPGGLRIPLQFSWTALALVGILLLAAFFRFNQLTGVPAEMTSDHAEKFLDIQSIQEGARPIFFPRNAGREGTQFYLASVLAHFTGYTYLTLKLVACAASLVGVPFVFLLGRTIYGPGIGLLAAFFIAISKWDIGVARFAIRAAFGEMWAAIALFLAYRALRRPHPNAFLWLGFAMGCGMYGYTSFRVVPLFIGLLVLAFAWLDPPSRARRRELIRGLGIAYGLAAIFALPLIRYAIDFPQDFLFRSVTRVTDAETAIAGAPLLVWIGNLWNMAASFNWQGDRSWTSQLPGEASLDWVTAMFFALGVIYALWRALARRDLTAASLLGSLFVLTLPSTLAIAFPIENPHLSRANTALPLALVLAALVPVALGRRFWPLISGSARGWIAAGVLLLGVLAIGSNYQSYFHGYAENHRLSTPNAKEVADVIRGYAGLTGSDRTAYLPVWGYWVDYRIVALELGDWNWKETGWLQDINQAATLANRPGPKMFILHQDNTKDLQYLRGLFPQAVVYEHPSAKPGKSFRSVFVPG